MTTKSSPGPRSASPRGDSSQAEHQICLRCFYQFAFPRWSSRRDRQAYAAQASRSRICSFGMRYGQLFAEQRATEKT